MSYLSLLNDDFDFDVDLDNLTNFQGVSTMESNVNSRHSTPMTEDEIEKERRKQIPKGTIYQNQWAKNVFDHWVRERNTSILNSESSQLMYLSEETSDGHEKLDCISKEKLSDALRFFFHEVRKQNGDRYPGETLRQLFFGIQRYIRFERRLDWQLMTDPLFLNCRDALDTAMKISTSKGLSLNRKIAAPISSELEEELWGKKLLGSDCPKKLTRTLLYLISINCGLRGGQELRQLKWGEGSQLTLQKLPDGTEVLNYKEDISKTNKGGLRDHHIEPKCFNIYPAKVEERCLVQLFKRFAHLRPSNDTSGAFFLQAHPKFSEKIWYLNSPIGHNTLKAMIKNLMDAAGEDSAHYSNHSGRRSAVCRIIEATGSKEIAKKITGHRSDCINGYNVIPEKTMKMTSEILTNSTATNIQITKVDENELAISTPNNKIMDVEIDGEKNKIMISFRPS